MKKQIIILIFGILLVSTLIIAVGLTNTSISLSKEQKTALENTGTGIYDFKVSEMKCDGETCEVNLFKQGAINKNIKLDEYYTNCSLQNCSSYNCVLYNYTCILYNETKGFGDECLETSESECLEQECSGYECVEYENIYYTDEELLQERDNKIKSILENIANVKISRDNKDYETKWDEGIVTITDK